MDGGRRRPVASRAARRRRGWIILGGVMALGLLAIASLHRIGTDERAFLISGGGAVTRLPPGWHVALPLLQRVVRIESGPLRVQGEVPISFPDGAPLAVPFEVWATIDDQPLMALLADPAGADGPIAFMRRSAELAIRAWGSGRDAPAIVMLAGGPEVEARLIADLDERGFDRIAAALKRVEGEADRLAEITREVLGGYGAKPAPIALIGLDGADWQVIDPLLERGDLPNLARLKANGAWGNMKSMTPMLSPLLWTSVVTGKRPDEHGIIDFMMLDPATGKGAPVSSNRRKVKALWNIFTDAERESAFIAWWASWPAEEIRGHMVSDRVAYSLFGFDAGEQDLAGATYPPSYFEHIRPKLVDDASIRLDEVQQFARVDEPMFRAMRARLQADRRAAYREPVNHLTKILASSRSYQAIALDILSRGQPDLFALYYQGIDEVSHRFAHYTPPQMSMVSDEEFRRYAGVVAAYYRYQDRQLGEVLAKLSPETTVIVMSDHGFENGSSRPRDDPPYIEGKPGLWHRRYGIFMMSGPRIRPGRLDTTGLLDIAPTILYLAGLPLAEDMPGRVIAEALNGTASAATPAALASYERIGRPLRASDTVAANAAVDQQMIEQLRALGYLGGGPSAGGARDPGDTGMSLPAGAAEGETLVTGFLNQASLYLQKGDYAAADAAVDKAMAIVPEFVSAWLVRAQIAAEQKQYDRAIEASHHALQINPDGERQVYTQLGHLYVESKKYDEGLAYLRRMAEAQPFVGEIPAAIGEVLLAAGDRAGAEKALLESLQIDPVLSEPLAELHTLYRGTERILELEEIVRTGLAIDDKSVVHHNWMGLIHEWRDEIDLAEKEFMRAIELDPEYTATMANLGALYGRIGRLDEAVSVLQRAVAKEDDNVEAWVNLGAAQGRLRRAPEAIEALEKARSLGARTTTLFNALALASLQAGRRDKALEYLKESLQIDPEQQDAKELMRAVNPPS